MGQSTRPTLLGSCARAATAVEAGFRVQYPNSQKRVTRIFALDDIAASVMTSIVGQSWNGAHFLRPDFAVDVDPETMQAADFALLGSNESKSSLIEELEGADQIVLISSGSENVGAAEVIAREAFYRNIMTAGLVLGEGQKKPEIDDVVNILRPFTSVLVVASGNDFVPAMLTALRA